MRKSLLHGSGQRGIGSGGTGGRDRGAGKAKAKAAGVYRGRVENIDRNEGIAAMLRDGRSDSQIQAATGCGRATVAKIAKREAEGAQA